VLGDGSGMDRSCCVVLALGSDKYGFCDCHGWIVEGGDCGCCRRVAGSRYCAFCAALTWRFRGVGVYFDG
jgi:hypothetical protein